MIQDVLNNHSVSNYLIYMTEGTGREGWQRTQIEYKHYIGMVT